MRYAFSIAVYVVVVGVFMVLAAQDPDGGAIVLSAFAALAAVHAIVGFTIGRVWALGLVLLLPLLGLPVPVPEDAYEPFPMWFVMLYLGIPIGLVLIGLGIAARIVWDWWRAPAAA